MKNYHYKVGDIVKCINPEGDLELNKEYGVLRVTKNNNIELFGMNAPYPHNCFLGTRFEWTGATMFQLETAQVDMIKFDTDWDYIIEEYEDELIEQEYENWKETQKDDITKCEDDFIM